MSKRLVYIALATVVALGANSTSLWAQCPPGTVQIGEQTESSPTVIVIHPVCQRIANTVLDLTAYDLTNIFNAAAATVNSTKNLDPKSQSRNCNLFFQAVGTQLHATTPEWHEGALANEIVKAIEKNESGDWKEVSDLAGIQQLANNGIIIVGGISGSPGHLAFAAPVPAGIDLRQFGTIGPMVRDGNVHKGQVYDKNSGQVVEKIKPSGWGAVRANYAFGDYESNPPRWFVWLPSCASAKCGYLK